VSRIEGDSRQSVFTVGESEEVTQRTTKERFVRSIRRSLINPLKIVLSDSRGVVGLGIIVLYVLMGTVGVHVVREPSANQADQLVPAFKTLALPLGSDGLGQDLLSLMVHATPSMLQMIIAGGLFATIMAVVLGTTAGFKGGTIDAVMMSFTDIAMTIPGLPLMIVLAGIFEPTNPYLVGFLLAINAWAGLARAIRSQVLTLRQESFVEAARAMDVPSHRLMYREILPHLLPYIAVNTAQAAQTIIFAAVGLYFLGILPFTGANWGIMLSQAYAASAFFSPTRIHWLIVPLVFITVFSIGLILVAQSLDRVFNPRVRARHGEEADLDVDEGEEQVSMVTGNM